MKSKSFKTLSPWISINSSGRYSPGRLFCFPFAGGGAMTFYHWPSLMLPNIELVRMHLPGREARINEPLITRFSFLMKKLMEEILPWIEGPFAFFGHSMGGLLAFELARELRRHHNLLPVHLFVSGFGAPHLSFSEISFSHLPDNEFLSQIRELGGIPELIAKNEEAMELFLPILKGDFRILETYDYRDEQPLECPITAFGGLSDPIFSREKILGWEIQTALKFKAQFFPGGHFFLFDSETLISNAINLQLHDSLLLI
jgi:medium-chain acyl-[acyl-carrier-protein] hydrolase